MSKMNVDAKVRIKNKLQEANAKKYSERIENIVLNIITEGTLYRGAYATAIAHEIVEDFVLYDVNAFVEILANKIEKE